MFLSVDSAEFLVEFLYQELESDEMGPFKIIDPKEVDEAQTKVKSEEFQRGYEEGYSDGLSEVPTNIQPSEIPEDVEQLIGYEAVKQLFVDGKVLCHRCLEERIVSLHHLVPREHGGDDNIENLIPLCNECHDEVEMLTEELIDKKGLFDPSELRTFVESGFPGE